MGISSSLQAAYEGIMADVDGRVHRAQAWLFYVAMVAAGLLVVACVFARPLEIVWSAVRTVLPAVVVILILCAIVFPTSFDGLLEWARSTQPARGMREATVHLLGADELDHSLAGAVRSEQLAPPKDWREITDRLNEFSLAVLGAKGAGKSKFLTFMHQPYRDGKAVTESRPLADTDGSGVTKQVFRIPTSLNEFGSLKLSSVAVDVWDVPGLLDDITWSERGNVACKLKEEMLEAIKRKTDETKWGFIVVVKVGGVRLDGEAQTLKILRDFRSRMSVNMSAAKRASCVLLTGLDELVWPFDCDDVFAKEKFHFEKPGVLEDATKTWLGAVPDDFRELIRECGDRALLWSSRPSNMSFTDRQKAERFEQVQMVALTRMLARNTHGQKYDNLYPSGSGCFPHSAKVQVEGGGVRSVSDLAIGDRVLTTRGWSTYFLSSHHVRDVHSEFVALATESGHEVKASPGHYVPTANGYYKEMSEVVIGDQVLVWVGRKLISSTVTAVKAAHDCGLYNPVTLQGDIIVNGVAMSCWSDWFLEGALPSGRIPHVYQAILAPVRLLYGFMPTAFKHFADKFEGDHASLDKQPTKLLLCASEAIVLTLLEGARQHSSYIQTLHEAFVCRLPPFWRPSLARRREDLLAT